MNALITATMDGLCALHGSAFAGRAVRRDVAGVYLGEDVVEAANIIERRVATRRR